MLIQQGKDPARITNNAVITSYYEVLTVNSIGSGTIEVGQQIQDYSSISANTCVIWSKISGGGNGSTWLVSCANPTEVQSSEEMVTTPCSIKVDTIGVTKVHGIIEVSANTYCPFKSTTIDYLSDISPGTVASQLLLTSTSNDSWAEKNWEIITNASDGMDYVMTLDPNFDAFALSYAFVKASPTVITHPAAAN
jgi:hypothetical protein